MADMLEIEGGLVRLVEREVIKTIPLAAFQNRLLATAGYRTRLLPQGTVLYAQRGFTAIYVIEEPPCRRTVKYRLSRARSAEGVKDASIALPWVYLTAEFKNYALENAYLHFAPSMLASERDHLYTAPLPNISANGHICLGTARFNVTANRSTVVAKLRQYIWDSVFNLDITENFQEAMPKRIADLAKANALMGVSGTQEDRLAAWSTIPDSEVCSLDWQSYLGLDSFIASVFGDEHYEDDGTEGPL